MSNFLITAIGRSGTKFLAEVMNTSPTWTVGHEVDAVFFTERRIKLAWEVGEWVYRTLQLACHSRFRHAHRYGEVNSLLRFYVKPASTRDGKGPIKDPPFRDFDVDIKGVILRNPYEIVESAMNRKNPDSWDEMIKLIIEDLRIMNWCVDNGFYVIKFDRMTSDKDYLRGVLKDFGITDAKLSLKKVNELAERTFHIKDLSLKQRRTLDAAAAPYVKRHAL